MLAPDFVKSPDADPVAEARNLRAGLLAVADSVRALERAAAPPPTVTVGVLTAETRETLLAALTAGLRALAGSKKAILGLASTLAVAAGKLGWHASPETIALALAPLLLALLGQAASDAVGKGKIEAQAKAQSQQLPQG